MVVIVGLLIVVSTGYDGLVCGNGNDRKCELTQASRTGVFIFFSSFCLSSMPLFNASSKSKSLNQLEKSSFFKVIRRYLQFIKNSISYG